MFAVWSDLLSLVWTFTFLTNIFFLACLLAWLQVYVLFNLLEFLAGEELWVQHKIPCEDEHKNDKVFRYLDMFMNPEL